jgi:uncharacterized glyoxalase superfamily protein PhnB/catechol 2,3-dioxygenase-like lactoylglutathione lyase family enzyme
MEPARVRYVVQDVDAAVDFYTRYLDFAVEMQPAPGFAALARGNLRLLLNAPGSGGAGHAMPDGTHPEPGGWNRIQIPVDDLRAVYANLRKRGARFRNQPIAGKGGLQVLLEDPSGNPVELFERQRKHAAPPIPDGYHTVTPFIVVPVVAALIEFVERAFGAIVDRLMTSDDGVIRHATVCIGDSKLMFSSGSELYESRPSTLHLYVEDVDAMYARAIAAGAQTLQAPADQFYGDRRAGVMDPWGNQWWIATHVEDVDEKQMKLREQEFRRRRGIA